MNISTIKVLDVMGTCRVRHEAKAKCADCIYNGSDCIEAHEYAYKAVNVLKRQEVINEQGQSQKINRPQY